MAKYGLGQKDLNARAILALAGLTDRPENDIAALFRSEQPIEPATRIRLAEALEGKKNGIHLNASNKSARTSFRAVRRDIQRVEIARRALRELGYDLAVERVAEELRMDESTGVKLVSDARKLDKWIAKIRSERTELNGLEDRELEIAFLYGKATKTDPIDILENSIEAVAQILSLVEKAEQAGRGIDLPLLRGPKI